jgi:hypothetical protein
MPSLWVETADGELVSLEPEGYATEVEFQRLLADNPELLASAVDQHGEETRWLLIDREVPIFSEEENDTTRWSLDHLFIDSDGTPVLVEVKRSSDPRARREVVGQMLDYAASFAPTWDADRLRDLWERQVERAGLDRDQVMDTFLEACSFEGEARFWAEVQTRIDAGQLRLLFVADRLSGTLVRIIDYLNAQLRHVEVLGVEIARHVASDSSLVAYEPVVHGTQPAGVTGPRAGRGGRRSRAEFDEVLTAHHGDEVLGCVQRLIDGALERGAFVSIGTSARSPRLFVNFRTATTGRVYWPLVIDPRPGKLSLFLRYLRHHPAFEEESVRAELVDRVAAAVRQPVRGDNLAGFPWVPVACMSEPQVVDDLLRVFDWVVGVADASS